MVNANDKKPPKQGAVLRQRASSASRSGSLSRHSSDTRFDRNAAIAYVNQAREQQPPQRSIQASVNKDRDESSSDDDFNHCDKNQQPKFKPPPVKSWFEQVSLKEFRCKRCKEVWCFLIMRLYERFLKIMSCLSFQDRQAK